MIIFLLLKTAPLPMQIGLEIGLALGAILLDNLYMLTDSGNAHVIPSNTIIHQNNATHNEQSHKKQAREPQIYTAVKNYYHNEEKQKSYTTGKP